MNADLSACFREQGLSVIEAEQLRHCREFFALPSRAGEGSSAIVGLLLIPGAEPLRLVSGEHGGPYGGVHRGDIPRGLGSGFTRYTLTHVEGHAAAVMHQRAIRWASLLIEQAPCGACDLNLPRMLPRGASLLVVPPSEACCYWSCQRA